MSEHSVMCRYCRNELARSNGKYCCERQEDLAEAQYKRAATRADDEVRSEMYYGTRLGAGFAAMNDDYHFYGF